MFNRVLILTLFLLTACTPAPNQKAAPPQAVPKNSQEVSPVVTATPSHATIVPPDLPEISVPSAAPKLQKKFTQLAIENLATQIGTNKESIKVVSTESMTWPNAGLGCPSPGDVYAQGRVPGFQIKLEAGGKVYIYHTDQKGKVILCPEVEPDEPGLR